jgi:hypothetical protein
VVVVGPDDTAEGISSQAAAWLSDFHTAEHPLPYVVSGAARLRAPDIAARLRGVAGLLIWSFSFVEVVSVRVLAVLARKNR